MITYINAKMGGCTNIHGKSCLLVVVGANIDRSNSRQVLIYLLKTDAENELQRRCGFSSAQRRLLWKFLIQFGPILTL